MCQILTEKGCTALPGCGLQRMSHIPFRAFAFSRMFHHTPHHHITAASYMREEEENKVHHHPLLRRTGASRIVTVPPTHGHRPVRPVPVESAVHDDHGPSQSLPSPSIRGLQTETGRPLHNRCDGCRTAVQSVEGINGSERTSECSVAPTLPHIRLFLCFYSLVYHSILHCTYLSQLFHHFQRTHCIHLRTFAFTAACWMLTRLTLTSTSLIDRRRLPTVDYASWLAIKDRRLLWWTRTTTATGRHRVSR